jgi:Zn-dependent protease with chaperone function
MVMQAGGSVVNAYAGRKDSERQALFNTVYGTGSNTPWFLRTHPLDEKRIADLQQWLPRATQEYRPAPK